jgi:hypothetical protein
VPGAGSDPCGGADADRGVAGALPDQAAVLVVLRARHRYALVVGLGARQGGKLAAGQGATNPWFECQSQPPAQSHLQGRCHHRPDPLHDDPLYQDYQRLLAGGTKPNLAKVTVARKVAAIVLSMWKAEEVYDPAKHRKPISQ